MTKTDFIASLAQVLDLPKTQADRAFDGVCATLAEALKAGQDVTLPGIGTLRVQGRPARTARNPRTGEAIPVPARRVVAFKTSSVLRKAL